jgi:hypothetical protein
MSLAEDVFSALTSGSPPMRAYPDELPQQVQLPALVYFVVAGTDDFHLQGRSGLVIRLVQVDAYAGTRLSADASIRDAVELMVASTSFQVNAISIPPVDDFEPDTRRYRASREFTLWIQE